MLQPQPSKAETSPMEVANDMPPPQTPIPPEKKQTRRSSNRNKRSKSQHSDSDQSTTDYADADAYEQDDHPCSSKLKKNQIKDLIASNAMLKLEIINSNIKTEHQEKLINELADKLITVTKRLECLEKRAATVLTDKAAEAATENSNAIQTAWTDVVKKRLCNLITKENTETVSKEGNIMIFGLRETEDTNKDLEEVKSLLNKIGAKFSSNNIKINRFKKTNNNSTPPIQVILKSKEEKLSVLKASKNLRDHQGYKGVYINPDYTKLELDLVKKLNQERKSKNEELENGETGKKFGLHRFGNDSTESKFYWGIRDFELKMIKFQ